ncbi:MAG: UDP-N-acetylmuramoyl-L-alanyl-D-glutamate--2,6-diaminopimelate ligase [Spirochaetales bacterium]
MGKKEGRLLSSLLPHLPDAKIVGKADPNITGITYDSRSVEKGNIFCALEGIHTDGHSYIPQAIQRGAGAILCSHLPKQLQEGILYIVVGNVQSAMSRLSSSFYDFPSKKLRVVGVTGTDGKSSTVYYIHQLLNALGKNSGLLSTVNLQTGETLDKNPLRQSTPEAPVIQQVLAEMWEKGKDTAIIEATSHGLSHRTGRLQDVEFDVGVVTNVTHEHLEFHGTWEAYLSDKTNLFRALSPDRSATKGCPCLGVVNRDDRSYSYILQHCSAPLYSYSIKNPQADLYASILHSDLSGNTFSLQEGPQLYPPLRIPLPGVFNVENVLASLLTVSRLEQLPLETFFPYLGNLKGVRGRMTPIVKGQPFSVIVDYAHTPGSFEKIFPQVRKYTQGKLIAVFGSAGERDLEKRPQQGKIASTFADLLVLTNEDPRLEEPMKILEDIARGCINKNKGKDLFLIPDRREAILFAFSLANSSDTVLLLGKGHESSIILAEGPIAWDEIQVSEQILEKMGYC